MRSLDDILIGFIIFFILERVVKLLGSIVVEPWIRAKMSDEKNVKNWVQFIDIAILLVVLGFVIKYQKQIASIAKIA